MGGTWGGIAQIAFFAGAAMVLAALLFSTAMRRRLMVFISKHFFRNKYDYRIEWLRFIQTLSSRGDTDIRRTSLRAIAQIFASPGGVLFTLDDTGRQFLPVAKWSQNSSDADERRCEAREIGADHELMQFLRERQWVVDLVEYAEAPDRYQNVALPECMQSTSTLRIVAPLLELDRLVGLVALQSPPAPFELTYEDRDLLKTVGRHVATYLAQHEANKKLAESRQFEAYSRLTAFMMHDLKNAAAQLSLIVANAERHKHNPEFVDDAIGTIGNASDRITRLIEQLQRGTSVQAGRRTDLCAVVRRAVARSETHVPAPQFALPNERIYITADPERLGMVLEHVIRNAQDATPADGKVTVSMSITGERVSVEVADTGQGMSAEFIRDRLFRPFDSTKGSKGMGIGAYQAREYVRSLGGEVSVESAPGVGTRFAIHLPVLSVEPAIAATNSDSETQTQTVTRTARQSMTFTPDSVAAATHNTADS
jgi:putative PEP-CTERM system histidine kinase